MNAITFKGRDLKDALTQVKQQIGEDALIISTREIKSGLMGRAVEVVAQRPEPTVEKKPNHAAHNAYKTAAAPAQDDISDRLKPLESELRRMRTQIVTLLDEPTVAVGFDTDLNARLRACGFTDGIATDWTSKLRKSPARGRDIVGDLLTGGVQVAGPIGSSGARIVFCVGPSGAGKTTTVAKWAATAALEQGKKVHIITLDTFRAGAVEQVQRYAELIGVNVSLANDAAEFDVALQQAHGADLVLVDTAGRHVQAQIELERILSDLNKRGEKPEVHLALPAMFSPKSLATVIATFRRFSVSRIVLTKVDEVVDFAPVAAAVLIAAIPLSYLTTGQRIPDDIEVATKDGFSARCVDSLVWPETLYASKGANAQ